MTTSTKRKTSVTLSADALDAARDLGVNVSAVAEDALVAAVRHAKREQWLNENADAFKAQSEWHEQNGHPLADIMSGPVKDSWKS
jgi:antitoxin CcdA